MTPTGTIKTSLDITGFAPMDSRWSAIDEDSYDGPGSPVGYGPTREAAINDLLEQLMPGFGEDQPEPCDYCNGTGWITVRTTFPCSYVCAGDPPEDARGMRGAPCCECNSFHHIGERAA